MTYRVYFNRELEWPQAWSVDEGDQTTEINVCGFELHGVEAQSHTLKQEQKDTTNRLNHPFAWMTVEGRLQMMNGIAHFFDC